MYSDYYKTKNALNGSKLLKTNIYITKQFNFNSSFTY